MSTDAALLTLREALRLAEAGPADPDADAPAVAVGLATGFESLHLGTFLAAYLQQASPRRGVTVLPSAYGDLAAAVSRFADGDAVGVAVALEWQDIDPRLGRRESVTAAIATAEEVIAAARSRLARLEAAVRRAAAGRRVVVCLPTLPLSPAYAGAVGRVGMLGAALDLALAEFVAALEAEPGVVTVRASGEAAPYDARTDATAGHPYTRAHASAVAARLAGALFPAPPKKGLITDLDDTVWRGIVGEVGTEGVHWNLDAGSHLHAQYQQMLVSLAARGVLIGIASKNDDAVVSAALQREDLLLRPEHYFPVVATWGPKSGSVSQILAAWNIGAGDVVFVDDSPAELAEVSREHPDITTLPFPRSSADDLAALLGQLNDLFWSEGTTVEDTLRLASLRSAAELTAAAGDDAVSEEFIASLEGELRVDVADGWTQERALQLVNKTNQFNLNGRRYTTAEWLERCQRPGAVNVTVDYSDRFGRLGTISVLQGVAHDGILEIETWVLSCRAFSRGVETRLLSWLHEHFEKVHLDFVATDRNGPAAELVASMPELPADPTPADAYPHLTVERGTL